MATIKNFTDLEQSNKLAKILPIESADMYYLYGDETDEHFGDGFYEEIENWFCDGSSRPVDIPCWSLAALLKCLSEIKPQVYTPVLFPSEGKWILQFAEHGHGNVCEIINENPVDACVAMIEKLHKLNLL